MASFILNATFDCRDPALVARFWAEVTGWPLTQQDGTPGHEEYSVGLPPEDSGSGPRLYFTQVPEKKRAKNRLHFDIVPDGVSQEQELARLVSLGATVVGGQPEDAGWIIMADPEGNEFCLEPGG
jgi:predicted enzyme related to lactoylglutathione lyase